MPLPLCQLFDTQWVWAASGAEGNDCDWVWRAAGDPAAVRGLLAERTRLDHPDDTVTGWTVEDAGDTGDRHLLPGWIVWHLNGLIARPVPVRCGSTLGLIDPAVEPSEIRPPYQRNQPPTMLIDGTLIPRMVIHHTTRKPA